MLDSPFWEEMLAEERVKMRAQERARSNALVLLKFAKARKLALPPDAEQRLAQLEPSVLEQLIDLAWSAPEAAVTALLAATQPRSS